MSAKPDVPRAELAITATVHGNRVRLAAVGEVDITTAGQLQAALVAALARATSSLVFDMAGVSFLDSTGIAALVHVHDQATAQGRELFITSPQPIVRRVLEVTGLLSVLSQPPVPSEE